MKSVSLPRAGTRNYSPTLAEQQATHTLLQLYYERFPAMKTALTSGKAGPLFTPDPDAIPADVQEAFDQVAPTLDRQGHARLALLCLYEASSAFGQQPRTVERIRELMVEAGIFNPEPCGKPS